MCTPSRQCDVQMRCIPRKPPLCTHDMHSSMRTRAQELCHAVQAFDAERAAPALTKLLQSQEGQDLVRGKTAVVPGCGCVRLPVARGGKLCGAELVDRHVCILTSSCKLSWPCWSSCRAHPRSVSSSAGRPDAAYCVMCCAASVHQCRAVRSRCAESVLVCCVHRPLSRSARRSAH